MIGGRGPRSVVQPDQVLRERRSGVHTPTVQTPGVHTPAVHTPAVHTPNVQIPPFWEHLLCVVHCDSEQTPAELHADLDELPEIEQVPADVQVLWVDLPDIEQTQALVQLDCVDLPDTEQVPAAVHVLWVVKLESEQALTQSLLSRMLPDVLHLPWVASHEFGSDFVLSSQ